MAKQYTMKKIFAMLFMSIVSLSLFSQNKWDVNDDDTKHFLSQPYYSAAEYHGSFKKASDVLQYVGFNDGDYYYFLSYEEICSNDLDSLGFYLYKTKGLDFSYGKLLIGYVYPDKAYPDIYYPMMTLALERIPMSTVQILNDENILITLRYGNCVENDSEGIPYKSTVNIYLTKDDSNFGYVLNLKKR